MKGFAGIVLALLLGGCTVVSEKPLFADKEAAPAQLAPGLWALSGPGCEVGPLPAGKALPECALPLTVDHGRMTMAIAEWIRSLAPSSGSASPLSSTTAATSAIPSGPFLLVAGDPLILQMLPRSGSPTTTTSYLALRTLHANGAGQIDRAVLWPVTCPDKSASQAGFVASQAGCTAQSAEAVRAQAVHMKPLMSYFLTWVRAEIPVSASSGP